MTLFNTIGDTTELRGAAGRLVFRALLAALLPAALLGAACGPPAAWAAEAGSRAGVDGGEHRQAVGEEGDNGVLLHDPLVEEIVVTAPLHRARRTSVQAVNVLAGEALRQHAASTLGETLSFQPGVQSSSAGPSVGVPVIRGHGADRVLVLRDSQPVFDASALGPDHAVVLDPGLASRIEVLRGPSTLLFGSGAIGGVVNVIDSRVPDHAPPGPTGILEQRHDTATDENSTVLSLDAGEGRWATHLEGVYRARDAASLPGPGVLANSDGRQRDGSVGFSRLGDRGWLGMALSGMDNNYGVPGEHGVRIDIARSAVEFKAELLEPFGHFESLRVKASASDFEQRELEDGQVGTSFSNRGWQARIELPQQHGEHWHGVVGVQLSAREFQPSGEEAFIPDADTSAAAIFVVEDLHLGRWLFELGGRLETSAVDAGAGGDPRHDAVSLSASAMYRVGSIDYLGLSLSRSGRAPNLVELFADGEHHGKGIYSKGDPGLGLEKASSLEIAWRREGRGVTGELNAYYNHVDDYVAELATGEVFDESSSAIVGSCPPGGECLPVFAHVAEDANFYGGEFQLGVPLVSGSTLSVDLHLFADIARGRLADGRGEVPRMPGPRWGARLDWTHPGGRLTGDLAAMRSEEQRHPGPGESQTAASNRLRASVAFSFGGAGTGQWTVFARGRNLLDEDIRDPTSFLRDVAPAPGRSLELGLRAEY